MIGEKVLGAFALAALACHRVSALVWFDITPTLGLMRNVPSLAVAEVRAPGCGAAACRSANPPVGHRGRLDATAARQVDQLLLNADVLELARLMWRTSREGWPALIADFGRLRRVDPDVQLDLL